MCGLSLDAHTGTSVTACWQTACQGCHRRLCTRATGRLPRNGAVSPQCTTARVQCHQNAVTAQWQSCQPRVPPASDSRLWQCAMPSLVHVSSRNRCQPVVVCVDATV